MAKYRSRRLLLSLLFILPFVSGCAFFNTLYNGWAAFDQAVATEEEMFNSGSDSTEIFNATESNFTRAVQKADKAIRYYPKSIRHHDDAFFLKGIALYELHGFLEAIATFKTLQERFPESGRIPESWIYLGMSYAGAGNYDMASETYQYVLDNYPDLNSNQEVLILQADLALSTRSKSQAIPYLLEALERITVPEQKVYIIDRLAGIYMDLSMYGSALEQFDLLPPFNRDYTQKYYLVQMKQGACYRELELYEDGEALYEEILDNRYYSLYLLDIKFEFGLLYYYEKEIEEARELFENITASSDISETIAKSWYQLSLIQIDIDGDLLEGTESLRKTIEITRESELRELAQRRLDGLNMIVAFQDSLENLGDSTNEWDIRFRLGERYWLDTKLPDSALVQYDNILSDTLVPDSVRAKTLFAKGWILQQVLEDTLQAKPLFEQVIEEYSLFEVAKGAQQMLDIPVTIMVRRDSAQTRFLEAEELRLNSEGYSKDVYYSYLITALKYPDIEDVAARSLYAAGWVVNQREGVIEEVDTSAAKIFGRLCREYPESEQCLDAQVMLENAQVQGFIEAYTLFLDEKGSEGDPEDSTILVIDSIAIVPEEEFTPLEIPDFSDWF